MKKVLAVIFVVITALHKQLLGQETWILKSAEDNGPIPYAKITEFESQLWTSSDLWGKFKLDLSTFPDHARFNISVMGHADTTVSVGMLRKNTVLLLRPSYVELAEYLVKSKRLEKHNIGDFDLPLSLSKKEGQKADPRTTNRYAVYVDFPGKKKRILPRLHFYLTDRGDPDVKFTLRVLVSNEIKKPKEGRIYSIRQFKDIKSWPHSLYESEGYGWTAIDLSQNEIIIPGKYKGAFLIFDVVDEGRESQKSMVIPFQDKSRENLHAGFYQTSGILGIYDWNSDHFAVVLEYLTE